MPFAVAEFDPREISFFHHDRAFRHYDPLQATIQSVYPGLTTLGRAGFGLGVAAGPRLFALGACAASGFFFVVVCWSVRRLAGMRCARPPSGALYARNGGEPSPLFQPVMRVAPMPKATTKPPTRQAYALLGMRYV